MKIEKGRHYKVEGHKTLVPNNKLFKLKYVNDTTAFGTFKSRGHNIPVSVPVSALREPQTGEVVRHQRRADAVKLLKETAQTCTNRAFGTEDVLFKEMADTLLAVAAFIQHDGRES